MWLRRVLTNYTTPGVWTMIEVKTLCVTASTHIQSHHTDRERLAALAAAIRASRRSEYRGVRSSPTLGILVSKDR